MKKESGSKLRRMEIEVHRDKGGAVTGHTVHHMHMMTPNKSGSMMEGAENSSYPFGAGDGAHAEMMAHIGKHLSDGMDAPKPQGSEQEEESEETPN